MGAFYNSICIPGRRRVEVRQALVRWLALKGFELRSGPVLFDLDGENERSAYLVVNERWTLLFFSHYDEERRLIRELQAELAPLLYVWVYDSDVWGWDQFDAAGFRGSFSSDSRSHISFGEEELRSPGRPWADPHLLCRELGLPDHLAAEIRRLGRLRSAFQEDVCRRFCGLLGAEAAASSYDDLESGAVSLLSGWSVEQLLFAGRDLERPGDVRLHDYDVRQRQTLVGYLPEQPVEFSPELLAEVEQMRRRARLKLRLLRPLSWIARGWRRYREARSHPAVAGAPPPPAPRPPYRQVGGGDLVNELHGCRITLVGDARPAPILSKPASVFAFEVASTRVTCTARRLRSLREVLRKPGRSRVVRDDKVRVGDLAVRHLAFELPRGGAAGRRERGHLALSVIQTDRAFYVFLFRYSAPLAESVERAIRATVESFRLEG